MTRSIISQRITSILDDIQRLNSALYAMNSTDIQRYPDNYEVLSTDAALRAETITCRLRQLLYASTNVKKIEYLTSAAAMQGIDIQQRGGIFEITLPCLLPKRRQSRSTEYLIDPLTAALEQYVKGHTVRRFRHCVVCFSHTYCQDLPERRVRDYDNLEIKRYLDAVGAWLLTDDGGLFCDVYHTTELGTTDCTRMFIMAPSQFPAWLAERDLQFQDGPKEQPESS